jgi:hypothetical protein
MTSQQQFRQTRLEETMSQYTHAIGPGSVGIFDNSFPRLESSLELEPPHIITNQPLFDIDSKSKLSKMKSLLSKEDRGDAALLR